MFRKGFELSDDELPEQDPDQPSCPDNEGPDIPVLVVVEPQVVVQVPPFDFHQSICRLGGNATTMFDALEQLDSHKPSGPIIVLSEHGGGSAR